MIETPSYLATPHDPAQDPAHRWRRAGYLIEGDRAPSWTQDDREVWAAWRYRGELEGLPTDSDGEIVAGCLCAIREAHRCFTAAPPLVRAELEARLLAGQCDEVIADKLGLSPAGVAAYHAVFFDVRSCLQADSYVMNVVLGGKIHSGLGRDDHELLMKAIGYAMGGAGVDAYLDFLNDPPVIPHSLEGLGLPTLKKLRDKLAFKVAVLATITPAEDASPAAWLWLGQRFAFRRRSGSAGTAELPTQSIRPALDAAAFAATALRDQTAVGPQERRKEWRAVVLRPFRFGGAADQEIRLAVPA